jgi:glycosyltransferase involved in cell wall biosynthesis
MKIGYYTEVFLGSNDGPAVNELEFIKSLSSLKKSEYVIFLASENEGNPVLTGLNVFFLGMTLRVSSLWKWIKRFLYINKKINAEGVDLLVCRVTDYPIALLLIQIFNPKVKIVIKTAALWWLGRNKTNKIMDIIYNYFNDVLTRLVYRNSDGIDVAMPETREILIHLGLARPDKACLIDNTINTKVFIPFSGVAARKKINIPEHATVLGFAGSLPSQRGGGQLLKVAERLNNGVSDLYLLIVGDDNHLCDLIKASRFPQEKIIHPGQVPYSEIPFYLSAMTLCYSFFEVHKIQKTGNASQKVKQYIAMGKPVISVDKGHKYLADADIGSPVDQNNIDEIANETLKWIKRIETEGDALSQRLHQYAKEHLSTEKTFQQRLAFWNSLLKDNEDVP